MQNTWKALKTGNYGEDQEKSNGIIISLLNLNLSQIEIRQTLNCSSSRVDRMRDRIKAGIQFVVPIRAAPSHKFSPKTTQFLFELMESCTPRLEQGFPCPHLRMKHYFIQVPGENLITWTSLHKEYKTAWDSQSEEDKSGSSCMNYVTTIPPSHNTYTKTNLA